MSDPALVSAVMREMAAKRWHGQRPVRLAKELALRAAELPPEERQRLLDALTPRTDQEKP